MESQLAQRAVSLVRQALHPHIRVETSATSDPNEPTAVLKASDGSTIALRFVTTLEDAAGEPGVHRVWVVPRSTRASHERLRREGKNFVALNGAVYLCLPGLLVDRTGIRIPRADAAPAHFDAFTDRSSLIARTLLDPGHRWTREWGIREIALAAGVAPATATRVARQLERDGVVRVIRSGRNARLRLSDPGALLERWTRRYHWLQNTTLAFQPPMGDAPRFLRRLPKLLGDRRWALTMHAGAAQLAPHATWDRVHLYVDAEGAADLLRIGQSLDWEPAQNGRVVLMKPYYKTSGWHGMQVIDTLPIVSTVQLVLDLWHYALRGREQAEHLLKTLVKADV